MYQTKVERKDIITSSKQLASMIETGLPIRQSLDALVSLQKNSAMRKIMQSIKESIENGATLAEALKKHPEHFNNFYVCMIDAGESAGQLDTVLNRLIEHLEKAEKFKAQIKSIITYPTVALAVAGLGIGAIFIFAIPVLEAIVVSMGGALPTPTKIVVWLSRIMISKSSSIIIGIILFSIAFQWYRNTLKGREFIDRIMLNLPVFGELLKKGAAAKFTRTLGILSIDLPISEALAVTATTTDNKAIEKAIIKVSAEIAKGRPLADSLSKVGVFPSMMCKMIGVTESAGGLDAMLVKVADFYEEEIDQALEKITAIIVPTSLVFICIGVIIMIFLVFFIACSLPFYGNSYV